MPTDQVNMFPVTIKLRGADEYVHVREGALAVSSEIDDFHWACEKAEADCYTFTHTFGDQFIVPDSEGKLCLRVTSDFEVGLNGFKLAKLDGEENFYQISHAASGNFITVTCALDSLKKQLALVKNSSEACVFELRWLKAPDAKTPKDEDVVSPDMGVKALPVAAILATTAITVGLASGSAEVQALPGETAPKEMSEAANEMMEGADTAAKLEKDVKDSKKATRVLGTLAAAAAVAATAAVATGPNDELCKAVAAKESIGTESKAESRSTPSAPGAELESTSEPDVDKSETKTPRPNEPEALSALAKLAVDTSPAKILPQRILTKKKASDEETGEKENPLASPSKKGRI